MIEGVLITDDLTGANASGVLIKNKGIIISTILNRDVCGKMIPDNSRIISYSTDSRGLSAADAYKKVYDAFRYYSSKSIKLYGKRIDSTMRGNIGAEIDAALDALSEDDRIAVVVPSFPDAGRTSIGGYLLVNGDLLDECDAAKDPKMPVSTSDIVAVINEQSARVIKSVDVNDIRYNSDNVKKNVSKWYGEGIRIIVFNAICNSDIRLISKLITELYLPIISVDPGPFTSEMAAEVFNSDKVSKKKTLLAVGSVVRTTFFQLEHLYNSYPVFKVEIDEEALLGTAEERFDEIRKVACLVTNNTKSNSIFCITTNTEEICKKVDLKTISIQKKISIEKLSEIINSGIAEIVKHILQECEAFESIFCSGGDTTKAVVEILEASHLNIEQEVLPLAVFGTIEGGLKPGLRIISKGGMVGSEDSITKCVNFIIRQV